MSEREIRVSQQELHRVHVVRLTLEGREGVGKGAKLLGVSVRQMKRLRRKMRAGGALGLLHGNCGKPAWNKTRCATVQKVIELAGGRYHGLNDTHFAEKLKEKEKVDLSRSTVRRILRGAGIAAVRKRGVKRHYRRRERKAQEGALLLWDGSAHRWFGKDLGECSLVAVIDDATGKLLYGVFAPQEDAQSYLLCLKQIILEHGIPWAIYMDRHGIFHRNDDHWTLQEQLAGQQTPTQVTQALLALGIQPLFALSPQAKGRVERLFNTLQDRLVQELRLARITSPEKATLFLNGSFRTDFNWRFGKPARQSQGAWRPLPKELDLDRICSFRYEATVGNDNAVRLSGMILDIPPGPRRRGYAQARVELRQLLDGRWRVYYKNELLVETPAPAVQTPLRTLRRHYRWAKERKIAEPNNRRKKRPPHFAYNARSHKGQYLEYLPK
ncbi:MAG TPA: ISNCY family transposase [candidate division Zixibacteria bacterium]|nr:ISNCY family transposase [candidate division Zixibacteria bacterium]